MNPNQQVWLNIDQMLQNLSTQPAAWWAQGGELVSVQSSSLGVSSVSSLWWTTLSVESLTKPTTVSIEVPKDQQSLSQHKRSLLFPSWAKTVVSIVWTLWILIVGAWVWSVQYPEETQQLMDNIFGASSNIIATTKNNMWPTQVLVDTALSGTDQSEMHGAAPDNYIQDTPLADAIATSQQQSDQPSSTQDMINQILPWADTGSTDQSWQDTVTSGSEGNPSSVVKSVDLPSWSTDQLTKSQLQEKLLTLSQQAQQSMTSLIGNSRSKLRIMQVIYTNTQQLLASLESTPLSSANEQYQKLQELYTSTVQ